MYVDTHTHAISSDHERYPLAPVGGKQSDWSAHRPADFESLLASLDEAGIRHAMVVQASTAYGNDNRYVLDAVKAYPDRFCGVFSIDVLAPDAVERFKYWLGEGLSGLRLFLTGTTMPGQAQWLDDERSYPVWEYAQSNNISICLQMTAAGIPALRRMLGLFPRSRVLLDHLARPDLADGPPYASAKTLFDLADHPGVYLKLTNRTIAEASRGASTPQAFMPAVLAAFGARRIAWGSNYPSAEGSLKSLLAEAQAGLAMLSDEDRAWIFGDTARSIYPELNRMGAPA
ncbi:amidohydrolase family protein [Paucibacter sp. R3-3]|uniref:Amidohydrolase family protein n=1 Tax=Roseateles agri TaxID=3098619 RepID=A0ABU5DRV6_9BURK|nr:amidohydrolase family protein [Paucibacter sp. R3-3]MDY0748473.1 amidohydrolase family protein [Paucibacter sp. R3-3]